MAIEKPVQLNLFNQLSFMHIGKGLDVLMDSLAAHIEAAPSMIRYAAVSTDEIFQRLDPSKTVDGAKNTQWQMFGMNLNVNITRLHSFNASCMCVGCGRVGNTFLIERHKNNASSARVLSLYSVTEKDMVLMTVDHILPDSFAGRYSTRNFQTMCSVCNCKKSNHMGLLEIAKVRANPEHHVKQWAHLPYVMLLLEMQEKLAYTSDKPTIATWKHHLNKALKHLDAGNNLQSMKARTGHLQMIVDQLKKGEPILNARQRAELASQVQPVVPVVVKEPTVRERMHSWFTSHAAALNKFYVVTQRTA